VHSALERGDELLALGHQPALDDRARVEPSLHRLDEGNVLRRDLRVERDRTPRCGPEERQRRIEAPTTATERRSKSAARSWPVIAAIFAPPDSPVVVVEIATKVP
jgi:hypothetical protein